MEMNTRRETARGAGGSKTDAITREVRSSLSRSPREIPSKYFYDARGSRLFDSICELPEYYVTRAERALLAAHADAIVDFTGASALIEIGS
ncbi:MAG: L-histidine N(alpha)-methyltransferase, partial [Polyangiaceae bacterium]